MRILDEFPVFALGVRVTQMIVFALFLGVVVFLGIASFMVASGRVEPVASPMLTWILVGVGAATVPLVLLLRHVVLGQARKAALAGEGPRPAPTRGRAAGPGQPGALDLAGTGAAGRLFQGWQTATIVTAAGFEGAALMGAVATLVEGYPAGVIAGGVFALVLLLFVPTQARFAQWLEGELQAIETERGRRD